MFALNNNKDNSVENEHLIKCQYSNVVFYYYSNTILTVYITWLDMGNYFFLLYFVELKL